MVDTGSFTAMVTSSRVNVLSRMHGMLESDPITTRDEFKDLMKAAFECGLDPQALAADLGFNVSTTYRWSEGRSAPHPSLWPTIVKWVMGAIERTVEDARRKEIVKE